MEVTRRVIDECLMECLTLLSTNGYQLPQHVEWVPISFERYLCGLKAAPYYRVLFERGFLQEDGRDITSFAVVYARDKQAVREALDVPYRIHLCEPIASRVLKPIETKKGREYLKHVLIHELSHFIEESLIQSQHLEWQRALESAQGNSVAAREYLANQLPSSLLRAEWVEEVEAELLAPLRVKIERIKRNQ